MTHYFIAIPIPASLRAIYYKWQEELKGTLSYKRWTAPEDLHITLSFLGKSSDETLTDLIKKLESVHVDEQLNLTVGGLNRFGRPDTPRVLFVDVKANQELHWLQKQIADVVTAAGFEREKRAYRPHITLAKKWKSSHSIAETDFIDLQTKFNETHSFDVTHFNLYKIHPAQTPSYEAIHLFSLNK